jgi:hypothetical protein
MPLPAVAEQRASSSSPPWLYLVALSLALVAAVPSRLVARVLPGRRVDRWAPMRAALAASGLSLGLGALIASLL